MAQTDQKGTESISIFCFIWKNVLAQLYLDEKLMSYICLLTNIDSIVADTRQTLQTISTFIYLFHWDTTPSVSDTRYFKYHRRVTRYNLAT